MAKKYKIDLICHAISMGGAERVMVLLAEKFAQKHDVRIITFSKSEAYALSEKVKHVKLHKGRIPNHTFKRLFNLLSFYRKKSNRPDITIGFITKINMVSILVSKIYKIKAIGCEHNNYLSDKRKLTYLARATTYKIADLITILTQFDAPYFQKKGVNVRVMYNPATFAPLIGPRQERKKNILVAGSLNKIYQKGWDNLIPIVGNLLRKHKDWKLLIAGSGEEGRKLLETQVSEQGLVDQVEFLGFTSNIGEIMQENEIFLMVSRYEGLPMVLIEAMSQGMACISYDCLTGPSEIITHKKDGLLVEDQNTDHMIKNLDYLMSNPEYRNNLAENAPQSVQKFNIESINEQWEGIFKDLLC